jgi:FdhE protein
MKNSAGAHIEGIPEIVAMHRPVPSQVFIRRAARFRSLASGNVLGDYLGVMALLAEAQHEALAEFHISPEIRPLPGEFPFQADKWRRDGVWQAALATILLKMTRAQLPSPARAALECLSASSPAELESAADALLTGNVLNPELPSATFTGSALQVYWTALACTVAIPGEPASRHLCPVCASPPIAGVVLGDSKLRYLLCGLCSTKWYLPRLTCSNCGSTEGISYLHIEGDKVGAKAECCSRCSTYLKLFYLESTPFAEPFADDVATLALDTLVSEEGYFRTGANIYLLPGAGS